MHALRVALIGLVLFPFAVADVSADVPQHRAHVDKALRESRGPSNRRVIVRYRPGREAQVRARLASRRAKALDVHQGPGALAVEIPFAEINRAAEDPDILGMSLDAIVTPDAAPPRSARSARSASRAASAVTRDAQALRETLGVTPLDTGADVGIALIDSGIRPSKDLQNRITAFYDFTRGGIPAAPLDPYGHGTHIAGLIAGSGAQSGGKYMGVATGVRLIGLRVLDKDGRGYTSDVIAAIEFAIANKARLRIDIINLSLGHPIYEEASTDPLVVAVEKAAAAGIVVVASAGNNGMNPETGLNGYGGINSPGNAPSALTVGSLRTKLTAARADDEVSRFSSRGPTWKDGFIKPDVLAPGQALAAVSGPTSTLSRDPALRADTHGYLKLSGTSMAAGVASGAVALVVEAHRRAHPGAPALTPNLVKGILQYTAIPVADPDPSTPAAFEQGAGGVNVAGALALTRALDVNQPRGTSWIAGGLQPFTTIGGEVSTWAQHIVWGDHLVWGDTVAWHVRAWALDEHIVWGDDDEHIVWGDATVAFLAGADLVRESYTVWSNHIVWGDFTLVALNDDGHIVWGDLDDEHIVWGDSKGNDVERLSDDEHIVWGDVSDSSGHTK